MRYKQFVSVNIAVIGPAKYAEEYAIRYAAAGHMVSIALMGGDDPDRTRNRMRVFDNISVCGIEDAAEDADMIVIASQPKDVREVAYWLGDVRNKVIIDCTANLMSEAEEMFNTIEAIKAITAAPNIVKVFSTRGYEQMLQPLFGHSDVQLIMAGESKKAKELAKILTVELGVDRFLDLGGADGLILFNEMIKSWHKASATYMPAKVTQKPKKIKQ